MQLSIYASHIINPLCEDLKKKLELYSSNYEDKSLKYYFEQERYIKIAEIIINKDNQDIQVMIDELPDYYQNAFFYKDGKFDIGNERSYICSQIYKQLYYNNSGDAFDSYLDIVNTKLHGDLHWFFELYFDSGFIEDDFLNKATDYIIEHSAKNWVEEFKNIDYERYGWLRYIEPDKIPKQFNNKEELYFWLKENKQCEVLSFLGKPLLNSLLSVVINHDKYNNNKNRIIRILEECEHDYILVGQILTNKNIKLNTFFLHFFKYSIFGFLNLYELDYSPHNLQSQNINYTQVWNEIISNQMIDIVFLQFSSLQNKDNFSKFVFDILNYLTKDYLNYFNNQYLSNKKEYLFKEFLKKLSNFEIAKGHYEKTFLMDVILDDLIEKQINQLNTEQINLSDYYLLSFYLLEIEKNRKILDKDYSKQINNIANSILENLEQLFINNLQDDRLYIKFEFLETINFTLIYKNSSNKKWISLIDFKKVKNRWLECDNEKSSKNGVSSSDPIEPKNIIKLYFNILLQIFLKNKENDIAKLLNELAIEFGLKIDFGIFHEYSWKGHQFTEELFFKYIKVLNNFSDKLFNDFVEEIFKMKKLRDILALLNYTESDERKRKLVHRINLYIEDEKFEFSSYYDIRESILYAQYNDLNELSTKLITIYSDKVEKSNYKNNKKEFLEIKCKKELLDIFDDKNLALDEKLVRLNKYQIPFDDRNYGLESKHAFCENYKSFIRAILFFETEPLKTYKILSELIDKELNSIYLINMLNGYFKAYENDEHKKTKFSYILSKYEEYDKKFNRQNKSLYEYQVLFYGYKEIGNIDKLEQLYNEIPDSFKDKIKDFLPNEIILFDKVVNIKKKLIVCVEGELDVKFIKNINKAIEEYKSIVNLENSDISIIPLGGGNLQNWVKENHLEGSNIVELHIYDSDVGASGKNEKKYLEECEKVKKRNDSSYCFLTRKREMENYIHKSLIEKEFGIDLSNIANWDNEDIPTYILNKIVNKKNEKAIKSILNGKLSMQMTRELLEDINAFDELKEWFEKMRELLQV